MQSGISVSPELLSKFNEFLTTPSAFALLVTIASEALVPLELLTSSSSAAVSSATFDADLALLAPHVQPKEPLFVLLRRHDTAPHLVVATYVPDAAPVRAKMLFASSRLALTRELGSEHFRDGVFVTDARELTPQGFRGIDAHASLDAPLTHEERTLGEVKRAEAEAGRGSAMREIHLSKSLDMPVADDALAALRGVGDGTGGGVVVLKVDTATESVQLDSPPTAAPGSIAELVASTSTTEPRFTFFRYPHTHDGVESSPVLFVYTNPSTTASGGIGGGAKATKHRMLYPLMKRAVLEVAAREGLVVDKKFEIENPSELTETDVLDELHPRAAAKSGFSRPKRPGR